MNVMSVLNQIMNQAQGGQSRQGSQGGMDVNQMMGNLGSQLSGGKGGSGIDVSYAIVPTSEGNYIAVGDARSNDGDVGNPKGNADVWIISFDDSGTLLWEKSLGGSQFETARSIAPAESGTFVIGGSTRSNDGDVSSKNGENDVWMITIDAAGNLLRQASAGGSSLDLGNGILYDNGMILVGSTESSDLDISENKGGIDGLLVKRIN